MRWFLVDSPAEGVDSQVGKCEVSSLGDAQRDRSIGSVDRLPFFLRLVLQPQKFSRLFFVDVRDRQ